MQSVTQDGVTIEFPDVIEPGQTEITWKAEANTGKDPIVTTFYLPTGKGAQATVTFTIAAAT